MAQNIFSKAEFLDRNGVAPIKPERDDDEDLLRRIPAHDQKPDRMRRHGIRVEKILGVENALALRLLARPSGGALTFEFVQRIHVYRRLQPAGFRDGTASRYMSMMSAFRSMSARPFGR